MEKVYWEIQEQNGTYILKTNLFDCGWGKQAERITSEELGYAFEPMARFENPDGSDLVVDQDLKGEKRKKENVYVGPFEERFTTLRLTPVR